MTSLTHDARERYSDLNKFDGSLESYDSKNFERHIFGSLNRNFLSYNQIYSNQSSVLAHHE